MLHENGALLIERGDMKRCAYYAKRPPLREEKSRPTDGSPTGLLTRQTFFKPFATSSSAVKGAFLV